MKKTIKTTGYDQTRHNDRTQSPNYLIGGDYEVSCNYEEALKEKQRMIDEAKETYKKNRGQKFQAKSYEWSAVVNIKPDTTMKDLEKLTQHFLEKYGFQCYQIAIHRDEGHFNDEGEKLINHHAHLEFITLDRQTGKNRQRDLSPKILREIQTEVAQILGMQRGIDKRISGVKRIEPRKYAQMKEQEREALKKQKEKMKEIEIENQRQKELKKRFDSRFNEIEKAILGKNTKDNYETATKNIILQHEITKKELENTKLSQKETKEIVENFRKYCIGKGLPKEFFRELTLLKNNKEPTTKETLETILNDLLQRYLESQTENQRLKENETNFKKEIEALANENNSLKQENEKLKENQAKEDKKTHNQNIDNLISQVDRAREEQLQRMSGEKETQIDYIGDALEVKKIRF